jgi:hypothetical protein
MSEIIDLPKALAVRAAQARAEEFRKGLITLWSLAVCFSPPGEATLSVLCKNQSQFNVVVKFFAAPFFVITTQKVQSGLLCFIEQVQT